MRIRNVLFVVAAIAWTAPAHPGAPAAIARPQASSVVYVPPIDAPITRHFEPPPTPYAAGHRGIDFGAPIGTPVAAAAGGIVAFAGQVGGSLFVSIDHPDGLRSTYSYLSAILTKSGRAVAQGDVIARSGAGQPGSDEKPNLHFGIRHGSDYLDPEPFLVSSFRRDFAGLVRLAGDEDRVGTPAAVVAIPAGARRRWRSRRITRRARFRCRTTRSSFASAAGSAVPNGP